VLPSAVDGAFITCIGYSHKMRNFLVLCFVVVVVLLAVPASSEVELRLQCVTQSSDSPSATNYATCPSGYTVTGCSCGMACGSYSIQAVSGGRTRCFCHLGCNGGNPIDWTTARCCKIAAS